MAVPKKSGGSNRSLGTPTSVSSGTDPKGVVLKTKGKLASKPEGSGAQIKAPLNKGTSKPGPRVIGIKGRTVAGTNKTIRSDGQ